MVAWPNAEISFMAPEMGAGILTKHAEPEKKAEAMKKTAKDLERNASVWGPAHEFLLDDIIASRGNKEGTVSYTHSFSCQDNRTSDIGNIDTIMNSRLLIFGQYLLASHI